MLSVVIQISKMHNSENKLCKLQFFKLQGPNKK
jgi:hypothetical protein